MITEVRLGDFCKVVTGKLNANEAVENGEYPFFTCSKEISRIDHHAFDCNAVLVAGNGDLNVKHYNGKFNAYQRTYVITSENDEKIYTRYLYYFLERYLEKLQAQAIGGVIKYIKKGNLTDAQIPLPPLQTQKKVAAILDKADALRQKRCQTIEKLDELTQSVFLDMFGDPYFNQKNFPLGTIRDMVGTTKYGTNKKAHEEDGEYPVIRMGNLTYSGEWDFTDMKYVDLEDDELEKYMVYEGDVLFNRTNSKELVGKTGVYRRENPMAYAGYLIRVRTNEKANSEFLSGFLNSPYGKKKLEHMCKSIVGMANINAQELQDIETIIPCINLQNEYKEKIKSIRKQRKNFELSLTKLDLLFNALLQKAFKGGLESSDSEEQLLAAEEVAEYSAG